MIKKTIHGGKKTTRGEGGRFLSSEEDVRLSRIPPEKRTFLICMQFIRSVSVFAPARINHYVPHSLKKRVKDQCKLEGLI